MEAEKFREALATECERSDLIIREIETTHAQNELGEAAKIRDDLRKSRETLAAERELYKAFAHAELKRDEESLAAKRKRFDRIVFRDLRESLSSKVRP